MSKRLAPGPDFRRIPLPWENLRWHVSQDLVHSLRTPFGLEKATGFDRFFSLEFELGVAPRVELVQKVDACVDVFVRVESGLGVEGDMSGGRAVAKVRVGSSGYLTWVYRRLF